MVNFKNKTLFSQILDGAFAPTSINLALPLPPSVFSSSSISLLPVVVI